MNKIASLLFTAKRSPKDRAQDVPRRAADTLAMGNIRRGQSILELEPGKGWFTDILLRLTVQGGHLTVQQPAALNPFFGNDAHQLVVKSGHPHARYSDASWDKLAPHNGTIDRVVWLQGPHELWFKPSPGVSFGQPNRVFAEIFRVLKPGGRLLVVDNLAPTAMANNAAGSLHRSNPRVLRGLVERSGLVLAAEDLNWIINQNDPLDVPTYSPQVHRKTHQFLQVFQKPM